MGTSVIGDNLGKITITGCWERGNLCFYRSPSKYFHMNLYHNKLMRNSMENLSAKVLIETCKWSILGLVATRSYRGCIAFDLLLKHYSVQKDLESWWRRALSPLGKEPFKSFPEKRVSICQDDCAEVKEKQQNSWVFSDIDFELILILPVPKCPQDPLVRVETYECHATEPSLLLSSWWVQWNKGAEHIDFPSP